MRSASWRQTIGAWSVWSLTMGLKSTWPEDPRKFGAGCARARWCPGDRYSLKNGLSESWEYPSAVFSDYPVFRSGRFVEQQAYCLP